MPNCQAVANNAAMHEWRRDAFNALKSAGASAAERPLWADYAAFCDLRERGLRREAFQRLDDFMQTIVDAGFEERRRFVRWLMPLSESDGGDGFLLRPKPLDRKIVGPTLHEWIESAPDDPQPLVWLGDERSLRRALALSPFQPEASLRLAETLLVHACYAQHELPWGLLGDVQEVKSWIAESGSLLENAAGHPKAAELTAIQADCAQLIQSYADYLESGEKETRGTFRDWAEGNGRAIRQTYGSPRRWGIVLSPREA